MTAMGGEHQLWRRRLHNLWLFLVQAKMTATAQIVRGSKLDEQAAVTSYNFPGINRG
jgi:hypothetical protein